MSSSKYARRKNPYDLTKWHPREVILARLEELDLNTKWLADRAGTSAAVVYKYLSGGREAETSTVNLAQMFCALGLSLSPSDRFDPAKVPLKAR